MNIKSFLLDPNRNFAAGVSLYKKVKTSTDYDAYFSGTIEATGGNIPIGSAAFNILEKQLKRALRKQLDVSESPDSSGPIIKAPITVKVISEKKAEKPVPEKEVKPYGRIVDLPGFTHIDQLTPEVRAAYFENKDLFVSMVEARQYIARCKTKEERQPWAAKLADIDKKKEKNYQIINKYRDEFNNKPVEEKPVVQDPKQEALETDRRIRTLKINISRASKEIKSGKYFGKKLDSRKRNLSLWETELNELLPKLQE